ncbi:lytic transglycosylase domain-containing protein [Streptomyces daliensis]
MTSTAIAAVAMAALTASQAPGAVLGGGSDEDGKARADSAQRDSGAQGDDSYHTELPPLESPAPSDGASAIPGVGEAESGIPASVLDAYKKAQSSLTASLPNCGLRWELLAAIGKVESGQARGGAVDKNGTTLKPILGPVLNGEGFARITDTDGGEWDGDSTYDRAVGPMQFIPSTWASWGADGNGDGRKDPNNVYDAALAAGKYLCAGGRDLSQKADLDRAILSYNNSQDYLRTVLSWYEFYRKGAHEVPDGLGQLPTSPGAGNKNASGGSSGGSGSGSSGGKSGDNGGSGKGGGKTPGGNGSQKPSKPGSPSPDPSKPGGSGGGGGESESPSPSPTAPSVLEHDSDRAVTATAGGTFAERLRVRAENSKGKPVDEARVKFAIVGETGARFPGGARSATVSTNADGIATAPKLSAGAEAGTFTVRATAVGTSLRADFSATVKARADKLTRVSGDELKAGANGSFADAVEVKATYKGAAVPGVPVSAKMITDGALPVQNHKGPYFKADGKTVRSLSGLKTDAEGVLRLPKIYTDGNEGTFKLQLTTADGAKLTVELEVAKS